MHWTFGYWISLGISALLVILWLILRTTGGYAPGWRIRCTACGQTRDAGRLGLIRVKARSTEKRIRGWCSHCKDLRLLAVERPSKAQARGTQSKTGQNA